MDSQQIQEQANKQAEKLNIVIDTASKKSWWKYIIYGFIGLFVIGIGIFLYNRFKPASAPVNVYQQTEPAKGMDDPPTETVTTTAPIRSYNKQLAAKKMELPPEVIADPKTALLSTSKLKPSEGGYTAATVLNTETGISTTIAREEPRPLFAFGGKTHVGALAGISTKGYLSVIYVGQDILRVGPVNLGVAGGGGAIGNEAVGGAVIHLHGSF